MRKLLQKTKKATALIIAAMLVIAMFPATLAAEASTVYEYAPGSTSNATTFTSVATTSGSSEPGVKYDTENNRLNITGIRYDRLSIAYDNDSGHAQYNAFRITGLKAGEYTVSFKNAAKDENEQQTSVTPAVYFFKAEDEYTALGANKTARANVVAPTVNSIIGYFNFASAPQGEYSTLKTDSGENVVVKVTEPGDYYIAFSYGPKAFENATHFKHKDGSVVTKENAENNADYRLELHLGGIKLEYVEPTVYEYAPGSTSNATTFTSVATTSGSSEPSVKYDTENNRLNITAIRYDRLSIAYDNDSGHAQYNAFRITGLKAGEYTVSFKNAAKDENEQQTSVTPAVYFFKAEDEYTALGANKTARANVVAPTVNSIIGYFNFETAPRGQYETLKSDDGENVVVKVTEPGDYYIAFSYGPEALKNATHFRVGNTAETKTKEEAKSDIDADPTDTVDGRQYYLELHLGGIKLEKMPSEEDLAEIVPTSLSYIVRADERANDGKVTVSDTKYTVNGTNVGEWTVDTSFTATATGDDFAYWTNGNGTPVSFDPSYTFTPKSNFVLEAVYAPVTDAAKKVQFWNYNKVFVDEVIADDETLGDKMLKDPLLNGWSFDKWTTDGSDTFTASTILEDAITRVVAQFTKNAAAFSVGGEIKAYDDIYTDTAADEKDGTAFSYWTIDGQVASYDKTLSFNVWDSVEVAAVYEGAKTAVPTVVLDKVNVDEYFIHYEVPAGYTAVDAGIVFSERGTPSVGSADSKASVAKAGANGEFTAAPGEATQTAARGYVMYKDSENNYRVIYSSLISADTEE